MSENSMKLVSKTDWEKVDSLSDAEIAVGIQNDPDAMPELSETQFAEARPASEVLPDIVKAYQQGRGPQKEPTKTPVSIRLTPEVLDYFKSEGKGWQTRINEVLEEYVVSQESSQE